MFLNFVEIHKIKQYNFVINAGNLGKLDRTIDKMEIYVNTKVMFHVKHKIKFVSRETNYWIKQKDVLYWKHKKYKEFSDGQNNSNC